MNCMNCGAFLTDRDLDYCPHCGCNVLIQKKADYLSRQYYNLGLEKASVRDLSGAISCLKQSLIYSKYNIQARNLLGLVYFETGEVVAALSEWVISKNLQPSRNLASEYINKLQANSNKLEVINETIRKYNEALNLCREGHEDMAAIRLKKILSQNPKLIKGYHLLALIRIKEGEYNKARRTLKKAARIDQTNTTTLRFLRNRQVFPQSLDVRIRDFSGMGMRLAVRKQEWDRRWWSRHLLTGNDPEFLCFLLWWLVLQLVCWPFICWLYRRSGRGFTEKPISRSSVTVMQYPAREQSLQKHRAR